MPKKKRRPRQPAHRARTTVVRQASEPDQEREYVDEFQPLLDRYPTVQDAVQAAEAGESVEWTGSIGGLPMRHRVVLAPEQLMVEQAILAGWPLDYMIRCAWFQSDAHVDTEKAVLKTLDELHELTRPLLEEQVRAVRPDYEAVALSAFAEPSDRGVPTFGWRARYPVIEGLTWQSTRDTAAWNLSGCFDAIDPIVDIPELGRPAIAARLSRNGAPLMVCKGCDLPLTDRHPRWTRVWVGPDGPRCEEPAVSDDGAQAGWDEEDFGYPHHPRPA
ncbi:hypothetical protein ACIBCU_37685 [Streptomyces sp. NPDC051064]|uniref:hypothetical protein n=1 Tax=Streptomyces sp. NPDC051064 TaxID=3365641 RepID=UPI0037AE9291